MYAVTDRSWLKGKSFISQIEEVLEAGATFLQLREKDLAFEEFLREAREVKKQLDSLNLKAEFVAPRLWMDPHTIDGGFMSTSAEDREYAMWRAYRSIDIANELGCDMIVLWLAREGTLPQRV